MTRHWPIASIGYVSIYCELWEITYFCPAIKKVHHKGDTIVLEHLVTSSDLAVFETGMVHPFYATFALGRDAEWACRQFVLNMKDDDEEGIGTYLQIVHKSPAMLGDKVIFNATVIKIEGNSIDCEFTAKVGERLVATGSAGQKILKKEKVERLVREIQGG